jgi:hypothetical protein
LARQPPEARTARLFTDLTKPSVLLRAHESEFRVGDGLGQSVCPEPIRWAAYF